MSAVEEVLEHPPTEGGRPGGKNRSTPSLWLLVPALAFFTAFALIPLVGVVILSFTNWDGLTSPTFAGIDNWATVLTESQTWASIWLSIKVMVICWLIQTPISILLGVFTAGHQRYRNLFAVLYFLPLLLSAAGMSHGRRTSTRGMTRWARSPTVSSAGTCWLGPPHRKT